jgi:hypothetical protein
MKVKRWLILVYMIIQVNAKETLTVRSVFYHWADKDKIESYLSCFYRKEFDEILRVIDSCSNCRL